MALTGEIRAVHARPEELSRVALEVAQRFHAPGVAVAKLLETLAPEERIFSAASETGATRRQDLARRS